MEPMGYVELLLERILGIFDILTIDHMMKNPFVLGSVLFGAELDDRLLGG